MKTFVLPFALALFAITSAASEQDLLSKANSRDYQAQRNLAYGYASGSGGQRKDVAEACAWYLLVLRSNSPKLDVSDVGNMATYCDKLPWDERLVAEKRANALQRKIY
ncbi:MAG: hypothetical protein JWL63_3231 [Rhodocyclales bacterium]|nr:hypothetical protein [Rhodocyclales bacterium]